jgi:hypothetical protein
MAWHRKRNEVLANGLVHRARAKANVAFAVNRGPGEGLRYAVGLWAWPLEASAPAVCAVSLAAVGVAGAIVVVDELSLPPVV